MDPAIRLHPASYRFIAQFYDRIASHPFITHGADRTSAPITTRTIWGLDPLALHHRYWAAHGVQVVRQGEPSEIVNHAELYLLTDPRSLVLFKMCRGDGGAELDQAAGAVPSPARWPRARLPRKGRHRRDKTGSSDFSACIDGSDDLRLARAVLTPDREVAQLWQSSPDPLTGWRRFAVISRATTAARFRSKAASMTAASTAKSPCSSAT